MGIKNIKINIKQYYTLYQNRAILDSSKNKSRLSTFNGVKFCCRLNLDPVFGVEKHSHTKYTQKKILPMLEYQSVC